MFGGVNSARHASCVHFDDGLGISCFGRKAVVSRLASIGNLQEWTCCVPARRARSHKNIMTIELKFPLDETSEQGLLLLFALLATEWNQNAKISNDTILLKCKQEVQADFKRHTSLDYTPFDPAVNTTKSYVKGNFESRWGF